MGKLLGVLIFLLSLLLPVVQHGTIHAVDTESQLVISHIKLNDDTIESQGSVQSVGIFNLSDEKMLLAGWTLEYAKPAFDSAKCGVADWGEASSGYSFALSGEIEPGQMLAFIPPGNVNKTTEGSFRIMAPEKDGVRVQHDLVGWGDTSKPSKCFEAAQAKLPGKNSLLTRCLEESDAFQDTNNNAEDFSIVTAANYAPSSCKPNVLQGDCESVAVTEVLPNPQADAGNEFIEVHNPTSETIQLEGCGIATSDDKEFMFAAGTELAAGEYEAFYDGVTGIGLTNSKSTGILVITSDEEFLKTTYPADLKDDIAWALIAGIWRETDNPTPGAANQPMSPEEAGGSGGDKGLGPCPVGKFRNPTTNRCKSIALASAALTPCKPGQVRNPETNRCRSAVLAGASLTPCKPGQERNPETNRCRSTLGASSTLKLCDEGEERNPETNRCRKAAPMLSGADPAGKEESDKKRLVNYGIVGLVGTTALGYGAYEYRGDLRNKFLSLKSRLFPGKSGK